MEEHLTHPPKVRLIPRSSLPGLLAIGTALGASGQAGADPIHQVVYNPLDLTITSDGPTTSATVSLPTIGVTADDGKGCLTFAASTSNGIRLTKPGAAGSASVNVFTQGSYANGKAPIDTPVTALNSTNVISASSSTATGSFSLNFGDTLQMISSDGSSGQFTVPAGKKYVGINFAATGGYYNGWIEFQTLSTGDTVSAHITGIALQGAPNVPIAAGSILSPLPGDANFDGTVNALDFNILASDFGKTSALWMDGDFNSDQTVDTADFTIQAANFGSVQTLPAPRPGSVVPEPTSLALLALGAAGLSAFRGRGGQYRA